MEVIQDGVLHLQESYNWALSQSDKRVEDWLLMSAYTPTLVLTALYLFSVWIGPKIMANREPIKFKYTLFIYNAVLVAINFHICYELFVNAWALNYSYSCQTVDYSDNPHEVRIAKALWWYYFSKLVEFLDTEFFILRKKNNQVSFLHVYHHATMFPIWWIGVKWVAGGQSFFGAMINSGIHVIMYTYYGISALGPEFQKYLWWKRYLTRLQLAQFGVCMVFAVRSIYIGCPFPLWMQYTSLLYGASIIALFLNFYYQAYLKQDRAKVAAAKAKALSSSSSSSSSSNDRVSSSSSKVQFVVGMAHAAQSLVVGCRYPIWMQWALIAYGGSILALFLNFYFHAYVKPKPKDSRNGHSTNGHVTAHGDGPAINGNKKRREVKKTK